MIIKNLFKQGITISIYNQFYIAALYSIFKHFYTIKDNILHL